MSGKNNPRLESNAGADLSQLSTRTSRGASHVAFLPWPLGLYLLLLAAFAPFLLFPTSASPQADNDDAIARLRIEVTAGEQNKPVADASVYVKFSEERKIRKDKKYELSLKTNEQGVTRTPEIPQG